MPRFDFLIKVSAQIRQAKGDHRTLLASQASEATQSLQAAQDACKEVERDSKKRIADAERQHASRLAVAEEAHSVRIRALLQEREQLEVTVGELRREIEALRKRFA